MASGISDLSGALRHVLEGGRLTRTESAAVFGDALASENDPAQLGGFLCALATRGEECDEIAGAADALRSRMEVFEHGHPTAIDTCGTGGDGLHSFNISTAAAIVAAAAGAKVVKHGNRSVSSKSGSADLLEAAGVRLDLDAEGARAVLEETGITFLFAPRYHPSMRFAGPVRKSLGVRTVFNFLGPLCNPGRVRRQLLGVGVGDRLFDFASVLGTLGCDRGLVVHGAGGADELTLAGMNRALVVGSTDSTPHDAGEAWSPATLGLDPANIEALRGGDPADNLGLLHDVLGGTTGPLLDAVALNAAAALWVAGLEATPADALLNARDTLLSGRARTTLERWVDVSKKHIGAGR